MTKIFYCTKLIICFNVIDTGEALIFKKKFLSGHSYPHFGLLATSALVFKAFGFYAHIVAGLDIVTGAEVSQIKE